MAGQNSSMTIYNTATLVQVVPHLFGKQQFLLDRFFNNFVLSDTREVDIDIEVGRRRLAPFCSPLVEGKMVESMRYQTNRFIPPYIKDKRAPDLQKPVRRAIGERIGGSLTPEQRYAANVAMEMEDQISMIDRRMEWMAARALCDGKVVVSGDGFSTTEIDFQRDASLTITLSGAARWGQAGVSPSKDIDTWGRNILKASGAVATDIVFTTSSWSEFLQDPVVKASQWYAGGGGAGNLVNVGAEIQRGAQYKGKWGQYDLWVYNDWYIDPETDEEVPMVPDGSVIMTGPDLMGTRAFGMIVDPAFNYGPMAYAPKIWLNEDPAQLFLMMQSSPLVIPSRVNAALSAKVK